MAQEMVPKAVVDMLMQQISALQATVERFTATIEEKDRIIAEKIEIILNQNRARFGQSSEKRAYLLCDGQTSMFDQAGDGITEKTPEETAADEKQPVQVTAHTRKAKRTLEEFAANLEEKVETIDLPEEEKVTADGRPLKCIGVDLVRSELIREPSKAYIRKIFVKTYADPKAEEETGQANAVYYYLFGDVPEHGKGPYNHSRLALQGETTLSYDKFDNAGVVCGTYIRSTANSDGSYNGDNGHSVIILSYDQSVVTFLDCNFDSQATIMLHEWMSWDSFNRYFTQWKGRRICHALIPIIDPNPKWTSVSTRNTEVCVDEPVDFDIASNVYQGYNGCYVDMYVWDSAAYASESDGTWVGVAGTKASYVFDKPGDYYVRSRVHNSEKRISYEINVVDGQNPEVLIYYSNTGYDFISVIGEPYDKIKGVSVGEYSVTYRTKDGRLAATCVGRCSRLSVSERTATHK